MTAKPELVQLIVRTLTPEQLRWIVQSCFADQEASIVWTGTAAEVAQAVVGRFERSGLLYDVPANLRSRYPLTLVEALAAAARGHRAEFEQIAAAFGVKLRHDLPPLRPPEGKNDRTRIFVSYARRDGHWGENVRSVLQVAGFDAFLDTRSIPPGDEWLERLESELRTCNFMLLLWSANAQASRWVEGEIRLALQIQQSFNLGRFLRIVTLDPTPLPRHLSGIQAVPLRVDAGSGGNALDGLVAPDRDALAHLIGRLRQ